MNAIIWTFGATKDRFERAACDAPTRAASWEPEGTVGAATGTIGRWLSIRNPFDCSVPAEQDWSPARYQRDRWAMGRRAGPTPSDNDSLATGN